MYAMLNRHQKLEGCLEGLFTTVHTRLVEYCDAQRAHTVQYVHMYDKSE